MPLPHRARRRRASLALGSPSLKHLAVLLTTSLSFLVLLLGGAPAVAAGGTGMPEILTPADGSTVQEYDGSWSIDFSDAPTGSYDVSVYTEHGESRYAVDVTDGTTVVTEVHTQDSMAHAGTVTIWVRSTADRSYTDTSRVTVIGYQEPELLAPDVDASRPIVWDDKVRIDFTGARPGGWYVTVQANGYDYNHTTYLTYDGTNDVVTVEFPVLKWSGQVRLDVGQNGPSPFHREYSFTNAYVPDVTVRGTSAQEFYPTVRDRFRDSVQVSYRLSGPGDVRLSVLDSDGKRVFYRDYPDRQSGANVATWKGMTFDGAPAPGRYELVLTTGVGTAEAKSDSAAVRAVTDFVKDSRRVERSGSQTTRRLRHGDCYYTASPGELSIDCVGSSNGDHAEARYGFRLPSSARNIVWQVRGRVGCCATGYLERGFRRTSATRGYVYVRLSNYRAYDVRRVIVTYDYQRQR